LTFTDFLLVDNLATLPGDNALLQPVISNVMVVISMVVLLRYIARKPCIGFINNVLMYWVIIGKVLISISGMLRSLLN
jgi:hypothetical protein